LLTDLLTVQRLARDN